DLAHLFFLIDTETKQVSQCRVTGVTNSGTAANLLGADQTVVPATAITSIENGSLVRCPAGHFLGSGVLPGDYATISGAGNLQPFSNNGYKWVVDQVIDASTILLRPMSVSELQTVGASVDDNQPIV